MVAYEYAVVGTFTACFETENGLLNMSIEPGSNSTGTCTRCLHPDAGNTYKQLTSGCCKF